LADFDSNGRATLGDAVYVGRERMTYGTTGVHTLTCMQGDFDGDGSFTINDAAQIAEAQFGKARLPWQLRRRAGEQDRGRGWNADE